MRAIISTLTLIGQLALCACTTAGTPVEYVLANGLRVRIVPTPGEKDAALLLGVRAGFFAEPKGVPHVAHVTEHLTVFDLEPKLRQKVDRWYKAGKANGETLADFMYFDLMIPKEEVDDAVAVQAARLHAPQFSKETLVREIPRTLNEISFVERSKTPAGGKFVLTAFVQAAVHGQSDTLIRQQTLKITVDEVGDFHKQNFRPDRSMLVIVGDLDTDSVRKSVERYFGGIAKPADHPPTRPELRAGEHTVTWDVATNHLLIGWQIPAADHADHPAITLAALSLMEVFQRDTSLGPLGRVTPSMNDIEGVFLINIQLPPNADIAGLQKTIIDRVAGLADPKVWSATRVRSLSRALGQLTMANLDVNKMFLWGRTTKTAAGANIAIQRMMKTLVWGNLENYRERTARVDPKTVPDVIGRYLSSQKACIVSVRPK